MRCDRNSLLLYAVTDRAWTGKQTLYEQVEAALRGGATFIQLREKEIDDEMFLEEALRIQEICRKFNVPFVINDDVEFAVKINADGVHVGQNDMDAGEVRKIIGSNKILGVSVGNVEQAIAAQRCGADYLGAGAVFYTASKDDAEYLSLETLKEICAAVTIPVVAIGGISEKNVELLKNSGICGVAVISALFAAENIEKAAEDLKKLTFEAVTG